MRDQSDLAPLIELLKMEAEKWPRARTEEDESKVELLWAGSGYPCNVALIARSSITLGSRSPVATTLTIAAEQETK